MALFYFKIIVCKYFHNVHRRFKRSACQMIKMTNEFKNVNVCSRLYFCSLIKLNVIQKFKWQFCSQDFNLHICLVFNFSIFDSSVFTNVSFCCSLKFKIKWSLACHCALCKILKKYEKWLGSTRRDFYCHRQEIFLGSWSDPPPPVGLGTPPATYVWIMALDPGGSKRMVFKTA